MTRFRRRPNPLAPPIANATSSPHIEPTRRLRAAEVAARSTRMPVCHVYRNGALNHTATGAYQTITFDTEVIDNDGMFTASSANLVVVTPGIYHIHGAFAFAANAVGVRYAQIYVNGAAAVAIQDEHAGVAFIASRQISHVVSLVAGDTISLAAFQNSGGNLAYNAGAAWTRLSAFMVSSA